MRTIGGRGYLRRYLIQSGGLSLILFANSVGFFFSKLVTLSQLRNRQNPEMSATEEPTPTAMVKTEISSLADEDVTESAAITHFHFVITEYYQHVRNLQHQYATSFNSNMTVKSSSHHSRSSF